MGNLERFMQDDGRTMRNLLGIWRDPEAFETALSTNSAGRIAELELNPDLIAPTFDRKHLSALHKHITQDVFEWAGKMRDETVTIEGERIGPVKTMAKAGGQKFDDEKDLKAGFRNLDKLIDVEAARKMSHGEFADHAARIFTHLNWMHPFREGNGRVQRAFISQYAQHTGHELDFKHITQGRIYEVSERSTRGHHAHMRRLFEEISDPACVERMRGPYQAFSKIEGFQQLYFSHAHPGQMVRGTMRGSGAGEFVVQNDKTKELTVAAIDDIPQDATPGTPIAFTPKTPFGPAGRQDDRQAERAEQR